ncbi:4-hydroxy-tetrahydrodipicolinate reductase [Devosia pacifica]|uniref:4-hydroxy-tetrahydrodipicolinate reductase n=1 Tax=Devosia pacifica TaxID=1335967 RepID=A0A918S4S4_9HYPH|nr:4-hydroxy-tetrahydrodipicolinate reductase [Devosia pacifica]GHA23169.1 4-hydroxy-tetrahydrodipicolinate reductase [Devosia pacifica]
MSQLKVVVAGAAGRMGAANIRAITEHPDTVLHAALDRDGSEAIGQDAGTLAGLPACGISITSDAEKALAEADAVIDFTTPGASVMLSKLTSGRKLVHVIGTTGCSIDDDAEIAAAAEAGARIVKSGNFSLGVNMLAALVRQAAAALEDYDIEVLEMHHSRKVDAPSGTALLLGKAAAAGRDVDLEERSVRVRDGHVGPREAGSIGFATLRGGTVVGEHSVILAGPHERIELTHRAEDRGIFANGAVKAALWAAGKDNGLYSMADVLGL